MNNQTLNLPWTDEQSALLSDKPMYRPRSWEEFIDSLEDRIDLAAIEAGKDEPGQPWEDVKKELGL